MGERKKLTPAEKYAARLSRAKGTSVKDAHREARGLAPGPGRQQHKTRYKKQSGETREPGWGM